MRLKDQHATAYLVGTIDTAVVSSLWDTAAATGSIRVENKAWVLDDTSELTDDGLDGLELHVTLSGQSGWLVIRVVNRRMLSVSGGTDAGAHAMLSELVRVAGKAGLSAHTTWSEAWESDARASRSLFSSPAWVGAWAVLAAGTVMSAGVAFAGLVAFSTAMLVVDAAALITFVALRRLPRR
jgi:hypothetical protein